MPKKLLATAALGVFGFAVLTGCAGGATTQSLDEACGIAEEQLILTVADIEASMDGLSAGDFGAAATAFTELESRLADTTEGISEPKVKAAMGELTDSVGAFSGLMDEADEKSSDVTALIEITDTMQNQVADIQTAGNNLQELCS